MTQNDFDEQLSILKRVFGEKSYPNERAAILFDYVKDCDIKPFSYVIKTWVGESKAAPLGDQFKDFARRFRINNKPPSIEPIKPSCMMCADSGWVYLTIKESLKETAIKLDLPLTCSAICTCHMSLGIKSKLEQSNELKSVLKSQLKPSHLEWYTAQVQWFEPKYLGLSWNSYLESPSS